LAGSAEGILPTANDSTGASGGAFGAGLAQAAISKPATIKAASTILFRIGVRPFFSCFSP
jgi:hypothetical protein